jgi:hypothetical protein
MPTSGYAPDLTLMPLLCATGSVRLDFLCLGVRHLTRELLEHGRSEMAHSFTSDYDYRDLRFEDQARLYRFGSAHPRYSRERAALSRVNGYLKSVIETIANAKRRLQRDLALRGIHFDLSDGAW